jgi:hypothetical protein
MMRRVILVIPAAVCFRRFPAFWQLSASAHFLWGRPASAGPGELLAEVAGLAPLLPGADQLAFVDVEAMQRRVNGHKKRGAAFGHTEISGKTVLVRGLNTLAVTISTPQAAPVIARTRLRGGSANSARGAAGFAAAAISATRAAGCTGTIVARAAAGFYGAASTGACRRALALLGHRADVSRSQGRDRVDTRGRVNDHQIPARDLGRPAAGVGL